MKLCEAGALVGIESAPNVDQRGEELFLADESALDPIMEDLAFSERGRGWKGVMDGRYDLDGELPVNPDGGLNSFGHPIGASGLRMLFECWLKFRREAGQRQLAESKLGLTHNLGGQPGACVSSISNVGAEADLAAA